MDHRLSAESFPVVNEGPPSRSPFLLRVGPSTENDGPGADDSEEYDDYPPTLEYFIPGGGPAYHIPPELRNRRQWVGWRRVERDGPGKKPTKVPINPHTGREAKADDPVTWATFSEALYGAVTGRWDGIGFVFTAGDPFVGIDLDDVIDPATAEVDADAVATIERFESYAELSPSGTGVHIIVRGELPPGGRKRGDRECYDRGRFFTFTGELVTEHGIAEGGAELEKWHAETFPVQERAEAPAGPRRPLDLSDQELLARISTSKQAEKFARLWTGDTTGYASGSEADLALCNILAFWTRRDSSAIDRLFRSSGLMRPKWDTRRGDSTYGRNTVARAIADATVDYDPNYKSGPTPTLSGGAAPQPGAQLGAGETAVPKYTFVDTNTFLDKDCRATFLIEKVLVRGQPCIVGGPQKCLKTSLIVDMAVSMATATPFLGQFDVKERVRVGIASGESGQFTLQETMKRVCKAKGIDPRSAGDWLRWEFSLPVLSDKPDMDAFSGVLGMHGVDVVFIDPAYLCLGDVDAKSVFEVGKVLRSVAQYLLSRNITPVIAHHANKRIESKKAMELEHLSHSGFAEYCRQWLLVSRREPFKGDGVHDLWLSIGGSAGHGGQWNLYVEEGMADEDFQGRQWNVSLRNPGEVRADKVDRNQKQKEYDRQKTVQNEDVELLKFIDRVVEKGENPPTQSIIRREFGWSGTKATDVITRLQEAELVEVVTYTKRSGKGKGRESKVTGYRRPAA